VLVTLAENPWLGLSDHFALSCRYSGAGWMGGRGWPLFIHQRATQWVDG
jgi:hypothetical protein